jgi:GAF domain-containing protein
MSYGESAAGWVAEHREAAWIADALKDPRVARRDWFEARGYRSLIALPMVHGDTLIAVLALVGKAPFPARHREMLELFAAQAAVAITNARLYADSNARRQAAEALAEVGEARRAASVHPELRLGHRRERREHRPPHPRDEIAPVVEVEVRDRNRVHLRPAVHAEAVSQSRENPRPAVEQEPPRALE